MSPEEKEDLLKRLRFFQPNEFIMGWDDIKWEYRGLTDVSNGGRPSFFRYTASFNVYGHTEKQRIFEWFGTQTAQEVKDPDLIAVLKMAAFPAIIDTEE